MEVAVKLLSDVLAPPPVDAIAIDNAARVLRGGGGNVLLLLAGDAVLGEGQALAWRIAQATGAGLMADALPAALLG